MYDVQMVLMNLSALTMMSRVDGSGGRDVAGAADARVVQQMIFSVDGD